MVEMYALSAQRFPKDGTGKRSVWGYFVQHPTLADYRYGSFGLPIARMMKSDPSVMGATCLEDAVLLSYMLLAKGGYEAFIKWAELGGPDAPITKMLGLLQSSVEKKWHPLLRHLNAEWVSYFRWLSETSHLLGMSHLLIDLRLDDVGMRGSWHYILKISMRMQDRRVNNFCKSILCKFEEASLWAVSDIMVKLARVPSVHPLAKAEVRKKMEAVRVVALELLTLHRDLLLSEIANALLSMLGPVIEFRSNRKAVRVMLERVKKQPLPSADKRSRFRPRERPISIADQERYDNALENIVVRFTEARLMAGAVSALLLFATPTYRNERIIVKGAKGNGELDPMLVEALRKVRDVWEITVPEEPLVRVLNNDRVEHHDELIKQLQSIGVQPPSPDMNDAHYGRINYWVDFSDLRMIQFALRAMQPYQIERAASSIVFELNNEVQVMPLILDMHKKIEAKQLELQQDVGSIDRRLRSLTSDLFASEVLAAGVVLPPNIAYDVVNVDEPRAARDLVRAAAIRLLKDYETLLSGGQYGILVGVVNEIVRDVLI